MSIETEDTWSAKTDHRPKRFSDFIGQPAVDVLRGQLEQKKVSKTYLITGEKGDGKSSLAWLLAMKILNTKDRKHPNIHHYVATVQSGVDDARNLVESLRFAPLQKGKKILIIEEAHGLTGKAADALLVVLENPPEHVVIILCTNEEQKLKPTVRDRCKKIKLLPLKAEQIEELLKRVAEKENVFQPFEDHKAVFRTLSKIFEGRNRDAINALSNLADIARVRKIEKEDISDVLKSVAGFDYSDVPKFLGRMYKGDHVEAFEIIQGVTDFNGFTHSLLDINTHFLKSRTGLKPPFHYGGKVLLATIGKHKVPIATAHKFQKELINMRREMTTGSAVDPEAIFVYYAINLGIGNDKAKDED